MDMDGEQPTRGFYWGLFDSQHQSSVVWSLKSLIPKNCILSPDFFICVKMHPWIDIWYRNWVPKKLRVPIFNMWGISKLNLNSLLRNKLKEQLYSPRLGEHISAISTQCTVVLQKVASEGSWSRRRPLLGPSPGWKRLLPLSHLRYY